MKKILGIFFVALFFLLHQSYALNTPDVYDPLKDYYSISSYDTSCVLHCHSEITIKQTKQIDKPVNFNNTYNFVFTDGKQEGKTLDNQEKGVTDKGLPFTLSLKNGVTCYDWKDDLGNQQTTCNDVLIPYTSIDLFQQLNNRGVAIIVLEGDKPKDASIKWSFRFGDLFIDPYWDNVIGLYDPWTPGSIRLANTSRTAIFVFDAGTGIAGINNISLLRDSATGTVPTMRVTLQGWNGTHPTTIFAETNMTFNVANNFIAAQFNSTVSIPSGLNAIVIYWLNGTIDASNRADLRLYNVTNNTFNLQDIYQYDNSNKSMRFYYSDDNNTHIRAGTTESVLFVLSSNISAIFGNGGFSNVGTTINKSSSAQQNFTVGSSNINVTTLGFKILSTVGPPCNITIYLVNLSIGSATWQSNIINSCARSIPAATEFVYNCTITNGQQLNGNRTYSFIPYHDDNDACTLSLQYLNYGIAGFGTLSYGNRSINAISTTTNFTGQSNLVGDLSIWAEYINITKQSSASLENISTLISFTNNARLQFTTNGFLQLVKA